MSRGAMTANIDAITGLKEAATKVPIHGDVGEGVISRLLYMSFSDDTTVTRTADLELRSLRPHGVSLALTA